MIKNADGSPLFTAGRAAIMGILNVTPDSFSDGGLFVSPVKAIDHVAKMIDEGADIIDIGGESTRPGAVPVTAEDEMQRVVPVIEALAQRFEVLISVDTSKAQVMSAAIAAGAGMINDVRALTEEGALAAAVSAGVPVCLMHMQGQPGTMQNSPAYDDVTAEVSDYLRQRVDECVKAGIDQDMIMLDPGFGFGKTQQQNFKLLNELEQVRVYALPLLVGLSRKSVIGQTLGLAVDDRLYASLGLALMAHRNGANILRVHDVRATRDAVRMVEAVLTES